MSHLSPSFSALCRVQANSLSHLAESVGSTKSIFLAALAGRRSFPDHRILNLKREIGLDADGGLDGNRLHHWKIRNAADLITVIESRFSSASLVRVECIGQTEVALPTLYLLQGSKKDGETVVYATIRDLNATRLATGLISISDDLLRVQNQDCWDQGLHDPAPVKSLLSGRSEKPLAWADVIEAAKGIGLTPEVALARLLETTPQAH